MIAANMFLSLLSIILAFRGTVVLASVCSGPPASPNWYGSVGYPPYFTRDLEENCPQKYDLSRCEQSAVMKDGSADFTTDENGLEVCNAPVECFATKQNCNDTLVCSNLLNLKDDLLEGGHNILCRHEKTYWQMYPGEVKNCHVNANCMDPEVAPTQRQLQPFGWNSAEAFANAFRNMDIPIGKAYSSPLTRCAQHAGLFADEGVSVDRLELFYMGGWKEVLQLNNITEIAKPNALKWQAYSLRNFAGKKPAPGTNNVMVTHGFNIKLSFGLAVDEGYCVVLKPDDQEASLAESVGTLEVANKKFTFDNDAFPVDAIARMSPESAIHMQSCHDVQQASLEAKEPTSLLAYDLNGDMKISGDEFDAAHKESNSNAAFQFLKSIQPSVLGKSLPSSDSIELGYFFHVNWGWREFTTSKGAIALPWRSVLENTIGAGGASPEERVLAFERANALVSILARVLLESSDSFPSLESMEEAFLACDAEAAVLAPLSSCHSRASSSGDQYYPMGPGDGGASGTSNSVFGTPLAYPSIWVPDSKFYDSNYAKVLSCVVSSGEMTLVEVLGAMGCMEDAESILDTSTAASLEAVAAECPEENLPKILAYVFGCLFGGMLLLVAYLLSARSKGGVESTGVEVLKDTAHQDSVHDTQRSLKQNISTGISPGDV